MNSRTLSMCSLPSSRTFSLSVSRWLTSTAATPPLQRRPPEWDWSAPGLTLAWTNNNRGCLTCSCLAWKKPQRRQHECKHTDWAPGLTRSSSLHHFTFNTYAIVGAAFSAQGCYRAIAASFTGVTAPRRHWWSVKSVRGWVWGHNHTEVKRRV